MVVTRPENHESKAKHVQATWGKRCDFLQFVSSQKESYLPTIVLNVAEESRLVAWNKTR
jgi:glycoprotein-N-acetylgalactosamine 3-beta-galactosyltransferase